MRRVRAAAALLVLLVLVVSGTSAQSPQAAAAPQFQRAFDGREPQIEEFMKTGEIERFKNVALGVTHPSRAWFKPGGPVTSVAWKPLKPGIYNGYFESYKSEIAAYEMDKLLGLHMVAPAVERTIDGVAGALIMWIDDVRMWKELGSKPASIAWSTQMVRMEMFDALIGNIDRNAGNILVDNRWTVYLIDHSRAYVTAKEPPAKFGHVDRALWERIQALDEARLQQTLGRWVDKNAITAILERRTRMAKAIDKLVKEKGANEVYLHY